MLLALVRLRVLDRCAVGPFAEHLGAERSRGDPGRSLVALCLGVTGRHLLERPRRRQVDGRHVVARRQPAAVMRLVPPGGPFERGDDQPAEQHDAADLERLQFRERQADGQREEKQHLEGEPRAAMIRHDRLFRLGRVVTLLGSR